MNHLDFEQVYQEHQKMVWNLAAKYVPGQQDKEDLFQEIFIKIHKGLPGFKNQAQLKTWIFRITINTAISFSQKLQRHKKLKEVLGWLAPWETTAAVMIDDKDQALKPLEKLNPKQKMIFILAEIEEHNLTDIANQLKIPLGTVKSNLARAKEILKKEVSKDG